MEWIAVWVILAIVAGVTLSLFLSPLTILMFGRAPEPAGADIDRGYVVSEGPTKTCSDYADELPPRALARRLP